MPARTQRTHQNLPPQLPVVPVIAAASVSLNACLVFTTLVFSIPLELSCCYYFLDEPVCARNDSNATVTATAAKLIILNLSSLMVVTKLEDGRRRFGRLGLCCSALIDLLFIYKKVNIILILFFLMETMSDKEQQSFAKLDEH